MDENNLNIDKDKKTQSPPIFEKLKFRNFLIWALISIIIVILILPGDTDTTTQLQEYEVSVVLEYSILLIMAVWIFWKFAFLRIDFGRFIGFLPRGFKFRSVIAITIPFILLSTGLGLITLVLLKDVFIQLLDSIEQSLATQADLQILSPFLVFLKVVIMAPIFEELFFRGVLLHRWSEKWNITKAMILLSVIFALLHPQDILGSFIFSIVLCVIYVNTKTLLIPIFIHGANNLFAFMMRFASSPATDELVITSEEVISSLFTGLVLLAIAIPWIIYILKRNWPKEGFTLPYYSNINLGSSSHNHKNTANGKHESPNTRYM